MGGGQAGKQVSASPCRAAAPHTAHLFWIQPLQQAHVREEHADVDREDGDLPREGLERGALQRGGGAKLRVQPAEGVVEVGAVQRQADRPEAQRLLPVDPANLQDYCGGECVLVAVGGRGRRRSLLA